MKALVCAGLLFGSSLLSAEVSNNSLQSADSQFLFGADAKEIKVAILSEQELQEIQGAQWAFTRWITRIFMGKPPYIMRPITRY